MKIKISIFILLPFIACGLYAEPQITRDPIQAGAAWEFGQFIKAVNNYQEIDTIRADSFNRFSVALT